MAVNPIDIINYRGQSDAGLGANNLPISAKGGNEATNRTAELMRQYDHENNLTIFNQKIKDRDKLLGLLMDEQVAAGDILAEDKKYYDEAERLQTDSYKAIKGLNDADGIRSNLKATKDLKDVTTWAQHKKIEIDKLRAEQAGMTLPQDRALMETHIQKQLAKKPGEFVEPYQKPFSTDIDGMKTAIIGSQMLTKGAGGNLSEKEVQTKTVTSTGKDGKVTTKEVVQTKPVVTGTQPATKKQVATGGTVVNEDGTISAISETPERYYDYPAMERRASELYYNDPVQAENQRQFVNTFNRMPLPAQVDFIKSNQRRIFDYYTERGIEPDENGRFPNDINYVVLEPVKDNDGKVVDYKPKYITQNIPASGQNTVLPQTGASSRAFPANINQASGEDKILITDSVPQFAAKHTLASIEGDYVERPKKIFDKDIANYLLGKEKADADAFYKKNMAAAAGLKARAYVRNIDSQIKKREGDEEKNKYIEEIYVRNLLEQRALATWIPGTTKYKLDNVSAQTSLPIFTFNDKGKPTILKPIGSQEVMGADEKVLGYKGGHYEQQYISDGKTVKAQDLMDDYLQFRKLYKKKYGNEYEKNFDGYLKEAIQNNRYDVKLVGENGATDKIISREAQRAISNQLTQKGEDAVFEIPVDEQIPE
jgi:hypothetical protein